MDSSDVITPLAALLLALLAPAADEILLKDGRLVSGTIVPGDDPASTRLRLGAVEIVLRNELIESSWVERPADLPPADAKEAENLQRGWVLFEGSWMSRARRDQLLAERSAARKTAIEQAVARQDWKRAVVQETRHFTLVSNATEALRAECAARLEAAWRHVAKDWGVSLAAGGGKTRVCVYRCYADYQAATGRAPWVQGYADWIARELHVWLDPRTPEDGLAVLNHEVTHLLLGLVDAGYAWPPWLNEGLAEYYGTARVRPDGELEVGAPQAGRLSTLRAARAAGRLPRLRDVMLTSEHDFRDGQYAVAWSFTRHLLQSPRHGRAFRLFFSTLPKNGDVHVDNVTSPRLKGATRRVPRAEDVVASLEQRLGRSLSQLEDEWLDGADEPDVQLSAAAWYEAARRFLLEARPDRQQVPAATEAFEQALAAGITDSRCWRDYAELVRKGGVMQAGDTPVAGGPDFARAFALARRAIELDPLDPWNYTEAAAACLPDGPSQDLDTAASLCDVAEALAAPGDTGTAQLLRELRALIEPARAQRAAAPGAATTPPDGG